MVPACHRARRLWMTKGAEDNISLCVLSCFESYRQQKKDLKVRDQMVLACHRANRLWMTKGAEDDVSLCVLSCFES